MEIRGSPTGESWSQCVGRRLPLGSRQGLRLSELTHNRVSQRTPRSRPQQRAPTLRCLRGKRALTPWSRRRALQSRGPRFSPVPAGEIKAPRRRLSGGKSEELLGAGSPWELNEGGYQRRRPRPHREGSLRPLCPAITTHPGLACRGIPPWNSLLPAENLTQRPSGVRPLRAACVHRRRGVAKTKMTLTCACEDVMATPGNSTVFNKYGMSGVSRTYCRLFGRPPRIRAMGCLFLHLAQSPHQMGL